MSRPGMVDRPIHKRLPAAVIGTAAAAAITQLARRVGALSPDGAVAAAAIGGAVAGGAGFRGGCALVTFFASSSALGRLPRRQPVNPQRRGNERDAVQVLANGGIPALLAVASRVAPPGWRSFLSAGFGGAVAAAAADTWATEIGSRYGGSPRSIATMRTVAPGASGGVSAVGLAASLAGAAAVAVILGSDPPCSRWAAVAAGGALGSLADSLLGATLQEVRWCDRCGQETESLIHGCGTSTRHLRGQTWCNNDAVNALATAAGALSAIAITYRACRWSHLTAAGNRPVPR